MTLTNQSTDKHSGSKDASQDRGKDIRPESLLCRLKYQNNLRELPFDPKFLAYPLEPSRFVQYVATSLERNYKHELITDITVGVEVDLIDPNVFRIDRSVKLHPDDEILLEDETPVTINARKSRHQKSVSWLRKTEYISTELYNRWSKSEKVESKLGYSVKRRLTEETVYRDRESQINAIEATFEAAKKPIQKHYSKPNVHAVDVLPVLPDFALWRYPCAQVIFDDDPSRKNKSTSEQKEEVNQAMIRGMVDETGDHFVAYFLPTETCKQLRRLDMDNRVPYTDGAAYEYELAREYNWNVKNKTMANYEENYFFVFRPDGVYYNELETRVRLSKRRKLTHTGGVVTVSGAPAAKTRLIVHHRDFTDDELKAQTDRLYMLEHDIEEEEEEEQEDERDQSGELTERHDDAEDRDHDADDDHTSVEEEEEEDTEKEQENVADKRSRGSRRTKEIFGGDESEGEDGDDADTEPTSDARHNLPRQEDPDHDELESSSEDEPPAPARASLTSSRYRPSSHNSRSVRSSDSSPSPRSHHSNAKIARRETVHKASSRTHSILSESSNDDFDDDDDDEMETAKVSVRSAPTTTAQKKQPAPSGRRSNVSATFGSNTEDEDSELSALSD